jgi:hypothetical protein
MDKAYKLLEELIALLAIERNQIANAIKTGTVPAKTTQAAVLTMATTAISEIAKIKRIESILEDVKSLFN